MGMLGPVLGAVGQGVSLVSGLMGQSAQQEAQEKGQRFQVEMMRRKAEEEAKVTRYMALQQSYVAEYNARISDTNALVVQDAARQDIKQMYRIGRFNQGSAISKITGGDLELQGSSLNVLNELNRQTQLETQKMRHAANVKSFNYLTEAQFQRYQGRQSLAAGEVKANALMASAPYWSED